jgi:hypothetical protein
VTSYFGSQWAILKSNVNLVTNMSLSNLTSCTLGGGKAIANPMYPVTGGALFFVALLYWGRNRPSNKTT